MELHEVFNFPLAPPSGFAVGLDTNSSGSDPGYMRIGKAKKWYTHSVLE